MTSRTLLLVSLLTLLGAGCTRPSAPATPSPTASDGAPLVYLPPESGIKTTPIAELREVLNAFQKTRSFHATISLSSKDGRSSGNIDVLKPDRFHGTLSVAGQPTGSEVIGVGSTLYVKNPTGQWEVINSPEISRALRNTFSDALNSDIDLINSRLPNSQNVEKTLDGDCTNYTTHLTEQDGSQTELRVCAKHGLPASVSINASDASVSIDYSDYNKLFKIERPTIPRPQMRI